MANWKKAAHVPFWNLWVTMEKQSQDRATNYTHTRTRPFPYHRQPSLSSGCIAQGLGKETFCLQQDGIGQGLATGTGNLRGLLWQFRKKVILRRSSSSHVMQAWASAAAGICGCGRIQQPYHADAGLRDGGHLWLRPVIVIRLIIKTRHCISGGDRVVHSGLGWRELQITEG